MNNLETNDQELLTVSNATFAELKDSYLRLRNNKDFQRLILNGYFRDHATNLVSLLATDHVKANGLRPDVMEQLIAISRLEDYFNTVVNLGPATAEELEADSED